MSFTSVINPFSQSIIAEIELDTEAEALIKLKKAHSLYIEKKRWHSIKDRLDILKKTHELLAAKRDLIVTTAIKEGGKPYKDTMIEFERGLFGIEIAIHELFNFKGEVINMGVDSASSGRLSFTIKEPRGVVFAISAFNHPFNLSIHQVIPAVATGCPVLIKPSLKTPLSAKILVDTLCEAGLAEGWCQYLALENDVTEKIIQNGMVGFMSFIGSANVGWYLRNKLVAGAGCQLEHGGIAPVIIDDRVDIDSIMPGLIRGSFYHAGQVCVKVQRIFVYRSIFEEFLEKFKAATEKLKVGDPADEDTDMGPLITPSDVNRVDGVVKESISRGAKLYFGGQKLSNTMYKPTILINPPWDSKISTEEIFGPVVAVYNFSDLDEAIRRANASDYFFQAAIYTKDIFTAFKAAKELNGRAVIINDHTAFRVDYMPFGGHRRSGLGVSGIRYSMEDLSIDKLLVITA